MSTRIARLISKLKSPAHLFTDKTDIFYLTGIELEGFWLLVTKRGASAFAPTMLAGQLKELSGIDVISCKVLTKCLVEYLREKKIKRLGVNGAKISHSLFKKLAKKAGLKDEGDVLSVLRRQKDEVELEVIKKSCKIAVSALKNAKRFIRPGISEEQISFKIEEFFIKHHARPAFPLIVACGPNSANPHHISSSRKIKPNDVILIDIGCVYKGYCSDLTRTFFLGKTNSLRKRVYAVVERAQKHAMAKVKAGAGAVAIDKAARSVIEKAGFGEKFIHSTGHGVGIDIHEEPRLSSTGKAVLKTGMVVTIEPGIYIEGDFGVRIEDTVVVTNKGREVYTR